MTQIQINVELVGAIYVPPNLQSSNMAMEKILFMTHDRYFPIEMPISSGFPSLPRLMKPQGRINQDQGEKSEICSPDLAGRTFVGQTTMVRVGSCSRN